MSRFDNVGLWWADYPVESNRGTRAYARTVEVPTTNWAPPKDFPNLTGAKVLGLDTETKDPELTTHGPGGVRGKGQMVGVSIATEDRAWYFPLRHEYFSQTALNMDSAKVFAWLNEQLARKVPVVGANLLYDLEWLRAEGVRRPAGDLYDVQYAEPLLDEESRNGYSLDALGKKYLGAGKDTPLLYKWCADSFGGEPNESQRKNIYRTPPTLVGPYAEADALMPVQILALQRKQLALEGLTDLFKLECGLIPLLLEMRFRGVRVDLDKARQVAKWLREEAAKAQAELPGVDVWSGESIARAFDKAGHEYLRTEAGNPSFTRPWLEACEYPLAQAVLRVRQYEKAANPFVEAYILGNHHNGRIHCQFNPLRGDEYGTVSGRFSSSNPNLQNIPARDPVLGPLLRSLFIPEEGCRWVRGDYSQIEYRMLVHYAVGRGAESLRERYRNEPDLSFHRLTMAMVLDVTGITLGYKPAKNLNFGLVYGMGRDKLTRSLGVEPDLGARLYDAYFEALPSVKATYNSASRLATRRSYIRTLLGRRRRFTGDDPGVHKALNACLQGSAADVIKKAMLDCWTAGLFADDACGIPHLTVHDELDWSCAEGRTAAFAAAKHIMETCVDVKVPLLLELSEGTNWGDCA
jgi:DNA polymerase I-like protein with 3'-5' exonuclease and polymerase domains